MRIAIMQPYFLPYIGYWQLIAAVDTFVVYDNIKYTKKGWINRNRFLLNGKETLFTLPLRKDSDFLDIHQRYLACSFDRKDLVNRFRQAYRKAPAFVDFMPVLEDVIHCPSDNLFEYIFSSIRTICIYLEIATKLVISSSVDCDHSLKSADRVKAICKSLGADTYINPIGGAELYSKKDFEQADVYLKFLQSIKMDYAQFGGAFIPWLSVVDVAMFNSKEQLRHHVLNSCQLC